ncbi:Mu transposase/integrase [Burkholderiales bacterium GJ-E10]|nr:Mu transposase/integrase [Burkholderiales bacterium GJ-E10]BAP88019.1 Mu transposase/integrase [Burkholderiales bacterium GJ-E10]BAP88174.1 Mu transposase/integrase [Burkholderiales bacterium GJ-E10]BAP89831.1 Mu transposase/integrase [Burkholderiales bacterium GJ-E10]BAP89843.1 Mu transposase/integrase [Burkholderiales bacterium GJ-E10]
MSEPDPGRAVALFRYGLIADLIHRPPAMPGLYALLARKAEQSYVIPGTTRTRVATETLRDWLQSYRRGGFDALVPKPRSDRGQSRALPQAVADALLSLKDEQPGLSIPLLIDTLRKQGAIGPEQDVPRTTVHRLLSRAGLMHKGAEQPTDQDRRRFAYAQPGQLWMSDVMHGPTVSVGASRRKTYLIAFIDDATRVVPYCAFALSENTAAFLPVFKQALMRRSIPQRLFVDNGANYRSQHLALVCAKLGVALIHARPYQPAGKGKQERWFRTVRSQLLSRLSAEDTASLDALNRRLWAWVEGEYHRTPHRGLDGQTPLERWAQCAEHLRAPDPRLDLDDLFLFEAKRRVHRDRTVSLNGTVFEVDASLVNETVTLRFDPAAPAGRGIEVWHNSVFIHRAKPVDAYANCFVRRNRPSRTLEAQAQPGSQPTPGLALRRLLTDKPDEESR